MAITKVSRNLLSTGVSDSSDATAITINSSEQVGIGTTSPNTLLHAATGSNGSGLIDVARFQNVGTTVNDGARIQLTAGTSTSGAGIGCLGDALNSAHLVLHAGGNTEQMRINSNGNVRVQNGNLEIGTDGKGIDFGSSSNASGMTAELLDDYEEGSWTPTLPNGGSITVNTATYTKIGRKVTAYCFIQFTATNDTSIFFIGGLPYNTPNNGNYYAGGSLSYSGAEDTSSFSDPLVIYNGDDIYFHYLTGTAAQVKNNQFAGRTVSMITQVHYDAA